MSSHISIWRPWPRSLFPPAWAHDPADAPIDTEIKALLFDPADAPIDTEMKIILWLENIEVPLLENTAGGGDAVLSGLGGRAAGRTGPTIAEHQPALTDAKVAAQ